MEKSSDTGQVFNNTVIHEGKAEILVSEKNVFYNPVQQFNRDLSVAVLSLFSQDRYNEKIAKNLNESSNNTHIDVPYLANENGISILEALSATGLRSIRYGKEVPYVKRIVANDISLKAVDSIKKNIKHNGMENLINANHQDATMFMYESRQNRFDVVDLDPYGCPSIFLDSAVQCLSNGGLLLVTATDMAVLAGNSPETCYVKYGAVSIKSKACHELALRILLQNIAAHAGRYGRYIEPLLSVSVDFYIRVFVRVFTGQIQCKKNTSKLGMVYQCIGCESMTIQPLGIANLESYKLPSGPPVDQLCNHCRHKHHIGGPIWIGSIHNQSFVTKLIESVENMKLGTLKRIKGVLNVIHEELDIPLYYVLDRLMSIVRCDTPSMIKFRSAILNAGYNVSFSHTNKLSIKTDAPNTIIWDLVRAWEKMHPAKRDRMDVNSAALAILTSNSVIDVSFQLHPLANPTSRKMHLARFQINPTANWGPGTRSTTIMDPNEISSKKRKNQNKQRKRYNNVKINEIDEIINENSVLNNDSPPLKQLKADYS